MAEAQQLGKPGVDLSESTIDPEAQGPSKNEHIDLNFIDDEEFYNKVEELINSSIPFSIRITSLTSPALFPGRLVELLQCFPETFHGEKWTAAYESLKDENMSSADPTARSFKQSFGKSFESPVNAKWKAFEAAVSNRLGGGELESTASTSFVMPIAPMSTTTHVIAKFGGSLWYGPQYAWSWATHQQKKRLSYIIGCTAAAGGAGKLAGPVGSAVAAAVGLTTAVWTSGTRTADVLVSKHDSDLNTGKCPEKAPVAVITFH